MRSCCKKDVDTRGKRGHDGRFIKRSSHLSGVIPIPAARFTLFWQESGIKARIPGQAVMTLGKWREALADPDQPLERMGPMGQSAACFVSVQNAREHGANLSSEC